MRLGLALPLLLTLFTTFGVAACSPAYVARYNGNNHRVDAPPVAPADVKIVKSRDNLTSGFTELGTYRGKAPSVTEAMDIAKEQCGSHGANLYILDVEPFASGGGFRIEGVCALRD